MAREAAGTLHSALATTPVDTPVWTWSDDRRVGFVRRRQAHEALVHRLDAELTVGTVTDFDPAREDCRGGVAWLWGRPTLGPVELSGDEAAWKRLRGIVDEGIE